MYDKDGNNVYTELVNRHGGKRKRKTLKEKNKIKIQKRTQIKIQKNKKKTTNLFLLVNIELMNKQKIIN